MTSAIDNPDPQQAATAGSAEPQQHDPIMVGIGASAGGLPALTALFDALPESTGMAFMVIMHLDSSRESSLPELLQSRTGMPVIQVRGRLHIKADHVYVIHSNQRLLASDHDLAPTGFDEPRRRRVPIDHLFRSLADAHGARVIGIILSGSGSDGAVGIKAINHAGGVSIAQDPEEAEFESMPRAAIATGRVDLVLPTRDIARNLVALAHHGNVAKAPEALLADNGERLTHLFDQLHNRTGHDFTHYQEATVLRRIGRRTQLKQVKDLRAYLDVVRDDPNEAEALFKDLLIGDTTLFRDPEAWQALADRVVPRLFAQKQAGDSVRAWVTGCSSGEEAYTLAMLLHEHAATLDPRPGIHVFASDIDEDGLARAREGLFPEGIEADLSEQRLAHFFTRDGNHYRANGALRESIVFATHDLLRDPPVSRVDLISCRNVLIYLERAMQERVFETFHDALRPRGFVFLGGTESIGASTLFETLDQTHRIYQVRARTGKVPHLPAMPLTDSRQRPPSASQPPAPRMAKNEELQTLNAELTSKLDEVSQAHGDLQNLMAATDIGTLFLDRELRIMRYTPRIHDLFNIASTDLGRPIGHFTHAFDDDALIRTAERVLHALTPEETEIRGKDDRWYLMQQRPYRSVDDRVDGVVITFVDITRRRAAEKALRDSEEHYRILLENVREYGIFMIDRERRITTWSAGCERIFGYREDEALGRSADLIFTAEDRDADVPGREMKTAIDRGEASDDRYHRRKDGSLFWANGVMTALYDADGHLRGFAKVLRDNTERKESEMRLQQLNETLEQRVAERTQQVQALASKLTMAEQEERRRISQMLHDNLQQLLYGVQMKLTMIAQESERGARSALQHRAEQACAAIDDAIRTTRQLAVDLSPPVLKGEGLTAAVRWLVSLMADVHELVVDLSADDELLIANEDMRVLLFQAARELLLNVVKHAGTNQASVALRVDAGRVSITVADDGRGFDPAVAEQRQNRFGLFAVRERLHLFGGDVTIDSAPDQGTRVVVSVPTELAASATESR